MANLSSQQEDPILIPIHSNGSIPEWDMIEINGELILPKEMPDGKENPADDSNIVTSAQVELGAVRFVDQASKDFLSTNCQPEHLDLIFHPLFSS